MTSGCCSLLCIEFGVCVFFLYSTLEPDCLRIHQQIAISLCTLHIHLFSALYQCHIHSKVITRLAKPPILLLNFWYSQRSTHPQLDSTQQLNRLPSHFACIHHLPSEFEIRNYQRGKLVRNLENRFWASYCKLCKWFTVFYCIKY